jgi:hypothetical protein
MHERRCHADSTSAGKRAGIYGSGSISRPGCIDGKGLGMQMISYCNRSEKADAANTHEPSLEALCRIRGLPVCYRIRHARINGAVNAVQCSMRWAMAT